MMHWRTGFKAMETINIMVRKDCVCEFAYGLILGPHPCLSVACLRRLCWWDHKKPIYGPLAVVARVETCC